ncbi:hypothetical protein [Olsenella uli]|uniref:hypothetical protein n=1 Tax=Olsenella uli TaxID=133926 RepID=UPI001EF42470|nr:hypothetical protein [Olsenella uli]
MTYNDHGGRSRQGSAPRSSSSRPYTQGSRERIPMQGSYHGPRGTRQRPSSPRRSSGPGYPLRTRNINFQSGRARRLSTNRRLLFLAALVVVLLVLLVVGISSCVRSCSADQASAEANPIDARVAAGVSEDLTREFSAELDQGEKLAQIAENADRYENTALLELALAQPAAIDFVAAYPDAEKTAQPYDGETSVGTVPELYCWDARWGNVDYAGAPLALTGSGPTALSMAYMAITGKGDRTPADFAQAASDAGMASGDSCLSGSYLEDADALGAFGLTCSTYTSNADNLTQVLDTGTYLLLEAQAGTLTDAAHWVIVVTENSDGSVQVFDPTSPEVSARPWDPATIAGSCETLYALSAADSNGGDAATE